MRKTLLLIAMMTATVAFRTVTKEPGVKRLDGSTISPAEIDATVTRLMRAAAWPPCARRRGCKHRDSQ